MRCFKCLKFGHTQKNCRATSKKCGNCANDEHTDREQNEKCTRVQKCVLCGRDHGSFSRKCEVYIMEKEIMNIKTRNKIPHAEARRKYNQSNPLGKRSYASTVYDNLMNQPPEKKKIGESRVQTRIKRNGGSSNPPLGQPPGNRGRSITQPSKENNAEETKKKQNKTANGHANDIEMDSKDGQSE
jgi:hypothetical protein